MVRMTLWALLIGLIAAPWQSLHAERLIIDGIDLDRSKAVRGISMQSLRARWGEPQTKRSAVGDPPITRWEYSDFVVYFEYRYVIHSVLKRR